MYFSNTRIHFQEDGCTYWYGIICLHADGLSSLVGGRLLIPLHVKKLHHTSTYRVKQKNGNFWKPLQKLKKSKKKKFIDRNWTITTCLLRDSNPNYQCLKITACRWRPPPRIHSFTATTHFKSSRSFVSPCVCCMLCRIRQSRILQSMQHKQGDTKEREIWNA